MRLIKMRVELAIVAGTLAASLLGATFMGCQSGPPSSMQSNQMQQGQMQTGQMQTAQMSAANQFGQYGRAPNGPTIGSLGATQPQFASTGMPNGVGQNQAFLAETQRIGNQQSISAQDIIAMQRAGMSEQQIAVAVQQRNANLQGTGAPVSVAQNGYAPGTIGTVETIRQPGSSFAPQFGSQVPPMNTPNMQQPGNMMTPTFNNPLPTNTPTAFAQADANPMPSAAVQPTGFDLPQGASAMQSADGPNFYGSAATQQTWRSKNP